MKRARETLPAALGTQDGDLARLAQRDSERRWRAIYESSAVGMSGSP